MAKPRFIASANGKTKAVNAEGKALKKSSSAAERERLTQQYVAAGQIKSKSSIAREARVNTGSDGG